MKRLFLACLMFSVMASADTLITNKDGTQARIVGDMVKVEIVAPLVPPPPPPPALTESADLTVVPPAIEIVDKGLATWTLTAGKQIVRSGVVDPVTKSVDMLLYFNHEVYQTAFTHWWVWRANAWVATADPRIAPPPPPPPPPPGPGTVPSDSAGTQAVSTSQLLAGFGINTHIDFGQYQNLGLTKVISMINTVGAGNLKLLRDSPGNDNDLAWWGQVAAATHAKFLAFIGEGSPGIYSAHLTRMKNMLPSGFLMGLEGGNEEDDSYPVSLGNSAAQAAAFQPQVFQTATAAHLPTFNISFGAGWCSAHDPTCTLGDYGTVGDLAAFTTYANSHVYSQGSPNYGGTFARLNSDANLAASGRPVAITEYGWKTSASPAGGFGVVVPAIQAAYVLEGMFDAVELGNPYYIYYALIDDGSGPFGLFDGAGNPKPAALALQNTFALLGDAGTFTPGKLGFTLTGMPAQSGGTGGHSQVYQKSDGSFWLVLYNEQQLNDAHANNALLNVAPVSVTLALSTQAVSLQVFDPLVGQAPVQTIANTKTAQLSVPAHPILVKIVR